MQAGMKLSNKLLTKVQPSIPDLASFKIKSGQIFLFKAFYSVTDCIDVSVLNFLPL